MANETVLTNGSLTISRVFRTSPERLYACWTDKAHLAAWAGPKGYASSPDVFDPRPGGHHLARLQAPDGSSMWAGGEYKVTDPGERLVFTHAWLGPDGMRESPETTVAVTFARMNGGTLMVFHQAGFVDGDSRDGHAQGWKGSFDRLDAYAIAGLAEDTPL